MKQQYRNLVSYAAAIAIIFGLFVAYLFYDIHREDIAYKRQFFDPPPTDTSLVALLQKGMNPDDLESAILIHSSPLAYVRIGKRNPYYIEPAILSARFWEKPGLYHNIAAAVGACDAVEPLLDGVYNPHAGVGGLSQGSPYENLSKLIEYKSDCERIYRKYGNYGYKVKADSLAKRVEELRVRLK